MPYFASRLPSPAEIVELPPEVLGLTLLRLERDRPQNEASLLSRSTIANPSFWAQEVGQDGASVQFQRAMAEAWDWLMAHGLVALRPMESSFSGWAFITRRGERMLEAAEPLELLRAEERIGVDLHPLIADDVRVQFLLGKYELGALAAMKAVEVRVRELAGAGHGDIGVKLMRAAFKLDGGPLTDPQQEAGEQEATSALFAGAIGVFKNPSSHREVEYDDPTFASEVILLGDLLLRMLDRVADRLDQS